MPKAEARARPSDDLVPLRWVREFFGGEEQPISPQTIYRWVKEGRLPKPVKIGHLSRWRRSECERARKEMEEREVP